MIVEFIGRSGIGKSYLAGKLIKALNNLGHDAVFAKHCLPTKSQQLSLQGLCYGFRLRAQLKGSSMRAWKQIPLCVSRMQAWRHLDRTVISDENIFQLLGTLMRRSLMVTQPDIIAAKLCTMPRHLLPDLVIDVQATPETTAERRMQHRGAGSIEYEHYIAGQSNMKDVVLHLTKTAALKPSLRYICVINESSECVDNNIRMLIKEINDYRYNVDH